MNVWFSQTVCALSQSLQSHCFTLKLFQTKTFSVFSLIRDLTTLVQFVLFLNDGTCLQRDTDSPLSVRAWLPLLQYFSFLTSHSIRKVDFASNTNLFAYLILVGGCGFTSSWLWLSKSYTLLGTVYPSYSCSAEPGLWVVMLPDVTHENSN